MKKLGASLSLLLATPLLAFAPLASAAESTVTVTPANSQGWSTASTTSGGSVNFITDATSPLPDGALQLTTDATTAAKAQYLHAANVPLTGITDLSYSTKQNSAPFLGADASYQLLVDLNGATTGGFTTLVYEPYQNGTVVPGEWQTWDVDAGQFWSTRAFSDGTCVTVSGGGGAPFYSLANLQATCPNAVVIGYGVNIGSNNPSYDVEVDKFVFNDVTYNFEQNHVITNKDQCKDGRWATSAAPVYKNQGECVSSFASKKKAAPISLPHF